MLEATKIKGVDEKSLWTRYKGRGDTKAREELIMMYLPLVKYVAGRLLMTMPPQVDLNDLQGYGILGLLEAIERYDPGRGVKFATYAISRIRGAVLDGLRAESWVPTSVRQKARNLERLYAEMEHRLGRSVSDEEMARELGISEEEFSNLVVEVSRGVVVSLEDVWPGEGDPGNRSLLERIEDPDAADPLQSLQFEEKKEILAKVLAKLPEKEKLVVTLYYYEGLTVKEIAEVMGISSSRVSQLHGKAILRLRGHLSRMKSILVG